MSIYLLDSLLGRITFLKNIFGRHDASYSTLLTKHPLFLKSLKDILQVLLTHTYLYILNLQLFYYSLLNIQLILI